MFRPMDCEDFLVGISIVIEQLLSDEFVAGIVDGLSGNGLCGMEEDAELCASAIAELIPFPLPALASGVDAEQSDSITGNVKVKKKAYSDHMKTIVKKINSYGNKNSTRSQYSGTCTCAHVYIVLKGRRLKLQVNYYLV